MDAGISVGATQSSIFCEKDCSIVSKKSREMKLSLGIGFQSPPVYFLGCCYARWGIGGSISGGYKKETYTPAGPCSRTKECMSVGIGATASGIVGVGTPSDASDDDFACNVEGSINGGVEATVEKCDDADTTVKVSGKITAEVAVNAAFWQVFKGTYVIWGGDFYDSSN